MNSTWLKVANYIAVSIVLLASGCAQKSEPNTEPEKKPLSYAEALQIYTAEAAELDRLKKELEELTSPDLLDTVSGLLGQNDLLGNTEELTKELEDLAPEGLDLSGNLANAQKQLENLENIAADSKGKKKASEDEIQKLKEKIAEQQARVDRARKAKDEAEAAQ